MIDLNQKIQDIRNSVTVEGKPLLEGEWTDKQIGNQIELIVGQREIADHELKEKMEAILAKAPLDLPTDQAASSVAFKIYDLVGWMDLPDYIPEFWKNFGSAPFTLAGNSNPKLDPSKGHKGMDEIFDGAFSTGIETLGLVTAFVDQLKTRIEEMKARREERQKVYSSPYASLEEIEEALPVKKAKAAAQIFWMDKTKPIEARIAVFNKLGTESTWIHHPKHPALNKIFQAYYDKGWAEKYRKITCLEVIDWWVDQLSFQRTHIDFSRNPYHPDLKTSERNYEPREEAMDRLYNYYLKLLFIEGVSSFTYDW